MSGHSGQGVESARWSGGRGMISNWWTEAAPWRWAVPRQSAPVSPPPMMTTRLPAAVIGGWPPGRPAAPGWPGAGTPWPGGCRPARGPGWAGRGPWWRRRPARRRRIAHAARPTLRSTPTSTAVRKLGALGPHLVEAAVEVALLHLELGDAVAQQAAEAVGPLVDDHGVAGPGQLLGGGQAGGAGADDGHRLARAHGGRHRSHPALGPGPVDDRDLDLLDGHRVGVDPEHAGRFARGRAQPPGELGEVVGGVQAVDGLAPVVAVDQVVPVGDEVAERAARCCRTGCRSPCSGWPGCAGASIGEGLVDLVPVLQPHRHRPPGGQLAVVLQEAGRITHVSPSLLAMIASIGVGAVDLGPAGGLEHSPVVAGHDLHEAGHRGVPVVEQPPATAEPVSARWRPMRSRSQATSSSGTGLEVDHLGVGCG